MAAAGSIAPRARTRTPVVPSVLVFLALVAFLPTTDLWASARPALTLRIVVVLFLLALGVPLLVRLVGRRDRAAMVALAFAAWALVTALASRAPLAWTGDYNAGTGAMFTAALASAWALGRTLPPDARRTIATAFLAGAAVNAAMAVLQPVLDLSQAERAFFDGRSTGLLGNPVFLGAACAAAIAFVPATLERRPALGLGLAALLAAAVQLSGARTALVVLGALGVWAATRNRRALGLALVAALAVGAFAGGLLQDDGASRATARVQAPGSGPRLDYWRVALDAAGARPLAGYGPGQFRAATAHRRSPAIARKGGADVLYADAHDLPLEYLVTTGVVGLVLLLAWFGLVGAELRRPARSDLGMAAVALLAVHLVEPQHLVLTPLMFLLAGGAGPSRSLPPSQAARRTTAVLGVAALVVAVRLVSGDLAFRRAEIDFDLDRMRIASGRLWPWPEPVRGESRLHLFRARTEKDPAELGAALDAARRARRLDPENPIRTADVASVLSQQGRSAAAATEYARALELDPWSAVAFRGRAAELDRLGRSDQADFCRMATRVRADRALEAARTRCLAPDARRERP